MEDQIQEDTHPNVSADRAPPEFSLPPNFDQLLVQMMMGDNLLVEPPGGFDGHAPPKTGKGTKVSPCVQMKLAKVEAEMARLAQEVETLGRARQDIRETSRILGREIELLTNAMQNVGQLQTYVHKNNDAIWEMLKRWDQELMREREVNANLRLD